ncbi:GntR family transcriptional regulator [Puniceicoccus vermicola]|uniref:GntR family transcriptional regulator n=1 Tax=Puniceicoccus vermicola TaxID=388746 RepID=A0A7X1B309_9BACT|nr:substrate-binding domain-containing protein [Puniceicoccus vermicola]MBC2603480.1 GntR family transcriptional regulator [Puniceicoccus vermicola]
MTQPSPSPRNKQAHVISDLTLTAHRLGPGTKLPTAQDLAKKYEITLTTLDRALAKLETQGVIHRRQGSGIYVSQYLNQKRVGLVFGQNLFQFGSSAFCLLLLQHCEKRARDQNERFTFFLLQPGEDQTSAETIVNQDLSESLKQGKLDGLLLCDLKDPAHRKWIREQEIQTVALFNFQGSPAVIMDMKTMIDLAAGALAKKGCKTIGLLGILRSHTPVVRQAATKYSLKLVDSWIGCPDDENDPPFDRHEDMGIELMSHLLEENEGLPDGLIVTDDVLARGACLALKKAGLVIGKDLQIATHANRGSLALEYWQDSLIRVEFDPAEVVDKMFAMLEVLMSGKTLKKKRTTVIPTLHEPATP